MGANWDEWGVHASGFVLQQKTESGALFNDGTPVAIGQPCISAGSGAPTVLLKSFPGMYSGGVSVAAPSRLWAADAAVRHEWYAFLCDSANLLSGFKFLNLRESLMIDSPSVFPGEGTQDARDSIRTRNDFNGGYVGYYAQIGGYDRGLGFDFTRNRGWAGSISGSI